MAQPLLCKKDNCLAIIFFFNSLKLNFYTRENFKVVGHENALV